jgi:hypothetical protein
MCFITKNGAYSTMKADINAARTLERWEKSEVSFFIRTMSSAILSAV